MIVAGWTDLADEAAAVYFGPEASQENFKAEAPGNRIIHLAPDGCFLEGACQPDIPTRELDSDIGFVGENPLLLSALFFAGANLHGQGTDCAGAEDGILTAYEVSAMDLEGTELVVLSACEAGLGEVKEGEGVHGLRRSFQMAGARTIIRALWPISDNTAAAMTSRLYGRGNRSLAETIRQIQLEAVSELRSEDKVDHLFLWAPFIAVEDWR